MSTDVPPPEFWRAVIYIHQKLFEAALADFHRHGRPPIHVYRRFQILDYWIDVALERGWLNDGNDTLDD